MENCKDALCIPPKVILSGIITERGKKKDLERWKISFAEESLCFP